MIAEIIGTAKEGININHRKENGFLYEYIAVVGKKNVMSPTQSDNGPDFGTFDSVNLRVYGTKNRNYVCLWAHGDGKWMSGSGWAGGWGYHRPSAAAQEAFKASGVKLSEDIDGRGDSAIVEAVTALAKTLNPDAVFIHVVHSHP